MVLVLEGEEEGEGVAVALGEEEEEKEATPQVKCCLCGTSRMKQNQLLCRRCFKMQQMSSCHEIEILGRGEGEEITRIDVLLINELMNAPDHYSSKA